MTFIEFVMSIYWYLAAVGLTVIGFVVIEILERRSMGGRGA